LLLLGSRERRKWSPEHVRVLRASGLLFYVTPRGRREELLRTTSPGRVIVVRTVVGEFDGLSSGGVDRVELAVVSDPTQVANLPFLPRKVASAGFTSIDPG
jgi:hypothetical protein